MRFDAYLLPRLIRPKALRGGTVVVADVLRASTTICVALAAGARRIVPVATVPQARRIAHARAPTRIVLGGERRGLKIPGFDLGNSPAEYLPAAVDGRSIVFTTTNGTRALAHCRMARRVLIGALVNFAAVCRSLVRQSHWQVLCAGTRGELTCEDVLLAGMLWHVWRAAHPDAQRSQWNDQAELAASLACAAGGSALGEYAATLAHGKAAAPPKQLIEAAEYVLRGSAGGQNLLAIGLAADITAAAQLSTIDLVPVWLPQANAIRPARLR